MSKHASVALREKQTEFCQDRALESISNWSLAVENVTPGAKQKTFTESWQCVHSKPCCEGNFYVGLVQMRHAPLNSFPETYVDTKPKNQLRILKEKKPNRLNGLAFNMVRRQVRVHCLWFASCRPEWHRNPKHLSLKAWCVFSGPSHNLSQWNCVQSMSTGSLTVPYPPQNTWTTWTTWTWNPKRAPQHQALFTLLPSGSHFSVGAIFSESRVPVSFVARTGSCRAQTDSEQCSDFSCTMCSFWVF